MLAFISQGTLIIAVRSNKTYMRASAEDLFPERAEVHEKSQRIVYAHSYAEAAGFLVAHRAGILFKSVSEEVNSLCVTEL